MSSNVTRSAVPLPLRLPLPVKFENEAMPPDPSSSPSRVNSAKRQTSSRIGIRNWIRICFSGLARLLVDRDACAAGRQRAEQALGLRVRRGVGGPERQPVLGVGDDARVVVEQHRAGDLVVARQRDERGQLGLLAGRFRPDVVEQREEDDGQGDRGDRQRHGEQVLAQDTQHAREHRNLAVSSAGLERRATRGSRRLARRTLQGWAGRGRLGRRPHGPATCRLGVAAATVVRETTAARDVRRASRCSRPEGRNWRG